jgi:hypothetical protein
MQMDQPPPPLPGSGDRCSSLVWLDSCGTRNSALQYGQRAVRPRLLLGVVTVRPQFRFGQIIVTDRLAELLSVTVILAPSDGVCGFSPWRPRNAADERLVADASTACGKHSKCPAHVAHKPGDGAPVARTRRGFELSGVVAGGPRMSGFAGRARRRDGYRPPRDAARRSG